MGYFQSPANIGRYDIQSGQWRPATAQESAATVKQREDERRSMRNQFFKNAALGTLGVVGAGLAAPAMAGAASGAASAAGTGAATAGTAGGGMTFGALLKLGQIAVPAVTGLFGQRSQNRALDRQSRIEQANYGQQLQMARDNEAYRRSEAERVAAEDKRRWDAEEVYRARQVAADEEERAYNRRLLEEREARRAPRRVAGQQALLRLQDLIRLGRR